MKQQARSPRGGSSTTWTLDVASVLRGESEGNGRVEGISIHQKKLQPLLVPRSGLTSLLALMHSTGVFLFSLDADVGHFPFWCPRPKLVRGAFYDLSNWISSATYGVYLGLYPQAWWGGNDAGCNRLTGTCRGLEEEVGYETSLSVRIIPFSLFPHSDSNRIAIRPTEKLEGRLDQTPSPLGQLKGPSWYRRAIPMLCGTAALYAHQGTHVKHKARTMKQRDAKSSRPADSGADALWERRHEAVTKRHSLPPSDTYIWNKCFPRKDSLWDECVQWKHYSTCSIFAHHIECGCLQDAILKVLGGGVLWYSCNSLLQNKHWQGCRWLGSRRLLEKQPAGSDLN